MAQETLQAEVKEFVSPKMVQIPLKEYKKYIKSKIKGPTVEILLEEYNGLRDNNMRMQHDIWDLRNQIQILENQIESMKDLDEQTDIVTHMVADEMAEKIIAEFKKTVDVVKKSEIGGK